MLGPGMVTSYERRSDGVPLPPGARSTATFGAAPFPPGQPQFIADIVAGARANGHGGLAVAPTRGGKTLMAVEAACRLGGATLVLCDRGGIMAQWKEAIEGRPGDPESPRVVDDRGRPVPVGVLREDRWEVDRPFCVGMLQTLARRALSEEDRRRFRTVILDECSTAPCATAWSALRRIEARYVVGLSATPDRGDGLGDAIPWIIGPTIAKMERRLDAEVWFRHVPYAAAEVDGRAASLTLFGKYNRVGAEKAIAADPDRRADVAREAIKARKAGRQVVVFAGLVDHLERIRDELRAQGCPEPGWYVGSADKREMARNPVLTTYAKAEKGEDFRPPPTLVIFASPPPADPSQAMGRGLQPQAPATPILLHYVDGHKVFEKQAYKALRVYRERGLRVMTDVRGVRA